MHMEPFYRLFPPSNPFISFDGNFDRFSYALAHELAKDGYRLVKKVGRNVMEITIIDDSGKGVFIPRAAEDYIRSNGFSFQEAVRTGSFYCDDLVQLQEEVLKRRRKMLGPVATVEGGHEILLLEPSYF